MDLGGGGGLVFKRELEKQRASILQPTTVESLVIPHSRRQVAPGSLSDMVNDLAERFGATA